MSDKQWSPMMQAIAGLVGGLIQRADHYNALNEKAVANNFYNLIPLITKVREEANKLEEQIKHEQLTGDLQGQTSANDELHGGVHPSESGPIHPV